MDRPPESLEAVVARCIPPACREEVLGDLSEKYTSPLQYCFLAVRTIPFVILSRLRRLNGPAFLFTDPVLIYAGFLLEAWDRDGLSHSNPTALLRLAIPAVLTWIYLLACDAFAPAPGKPAAFEPAALIAVCVFMGIAGSLTWLNGFFAAVILVSSTRLLLPIDQNPRRAWLINSPISRKVYAAAVISWVLLHFSGILLRVGAGLVAVLIGYWLIKRRIAKSNSPHDPL